MLDMLTLSAHAQEFLEREKLDWRVNKIALFNQDATQVAPRLGIAREDTGEILGVVGYRYQPFQNDRMVEIVQRIADKAELDLATATVMNNGAKIALQLYTDDYPGLGNNSGTIKGYITVINSHDGSTGLRFGNNLFDMWCKNQFYRIYNKLKGQFSFSHTTNINQMVDNALFEIDTLRQRQVNIVGNFFHMADVSVTNELINALTYRLTGVDRLAKDFDPANYSPYKLNQDTELRHDIIEEMSYKGQTRWGLFSGVTKYTTHHMRAPRRENGRDESKMFAGAGKWDNVAYDMLSVQ